MKRTTKVSLIVGLALLGGASAVVWSTRRPAAVELVAVETREITEVYVATGRLSSPIVSGVGSELAGRIATVHVREGDRPSAGDALVDLQPLDAKLAVRQAEARVTITEKELAKVHQGATRAELARARADVSAAEAEMEQARRDADRAQALSRDGVGTPAQLERARTDVRRAESRLAAARAGLSQLKEPPRATDLRVAQARIDEAETNLEQTQLTLGKTTITSPFNGLVLQVDAAPGENVAAGQALVTVARTDAMEVHAEVDEDYFARIAPGQKGTLVFPSIPDQRFAAEVTRVGPEVDYERGVIAVHLMPDSLPKFVVPGLTVDVAIELKRLQGAAVPRSALIREGAAAYVYVVSEGQAKRVDVDVTAEGEEFLAVKGIGEKQVILRAADVSEGQSVRAREVR